MRRGAILFFIDTARGFCRAHNSETLDNQSLKCSDINIVREKNNGNLGRFCQVINLPLRVCNKLQVRPRLLLCCPDNTSESQALHGLRDRRNLNEDCIQIQNTWACKIIIKIVSPHIASVSARLHFACRRLLTRLLLLLH